MHRSIASSSVSAGLLMFLLLASASAVAQNYPTYPPHQTTQQRGDVVAGRYLGCFKDTSAYDLDGHLERGGTNTPNYCIATCAARGFAYAGVQYGESCLCGNSYGRYGAANNCDYRCTGDSSQVCGGYNANSVYATGVAAARTTTTTTTTTASAPVHCGPPSGQYEYNTNRYGGDYQRYAVDASTCPQQCAQACEADPQCQAWSFVRVGYPDAGCYLKNSQPRPTANPCCDSGTVQRAGAGAPNCGPPNPSYEYNTNRYGGDYQRYAVTAATCPQQCAQACEADGRCQAWSFVRAGYPDAGCYLKDSQPRPTANPCCDSGTVARSAGPGAGSGNWTAWSDRDDPGESADYEDLGSIRGSVPCAQPIGIECRVVSDKRDWTQAGQRYSCSLQAQVPGGICINAENDNRCLDYEVRYLCP